MSKHVRPRQARSPRHHPLPQAADQRTDRRGRPRVLALANQKGGVGKTTTAINLGTALAAIGEHVLIVDIDPQGNASTGLGIERNAPRLDLRRADRRGAACATAAMPTAVPRLDIVPSTLDLSASSLRSASTRDRAFRLRKALRRSRWSRANTAYSYILVDCPPSLNLLTINAMAAATRCSCRCNASSSRSKA